MENTIVVLELGLTFFFFFFLMAGWFGCYDLFARVAGVMVLCVKCFCTVKNNSKS